MNERRFCLRCTGSGRVLAHPRPCVHFERAPGCLECEKPQSATTKECPVCLGRGSIDDEEWARWLERRAL